MGRSAPVCRREVAILRTSVAEEERDADDPARLADEALENVQKAANELRAHGIPIETEPPTIYRPR
jgi:hypothetical protein